MESKMDIPLSANILIKLLLTITVIFILIVAKTLLIPLFFAILFAYALYPSANKLEKAGVPRIAANLILIVSLIAVAGLGIYGVTQLSETLTDDLPTIKENVEQNISAVEETVRGWINISEEQVESFTDRIQNSGQIIGTVFSSTTNTILSIGLLPVYTFLLLFYRNKFREFISQVSSAENKEITDRIIRQASDVVPRYLKGLFLVCLILVLLNSVGFYIIGIEYALLMGVIAAFFNLIPYLGTVFGYGIVFLFVFLTQSPALSVAVAVQFFIVQFIENYILTPNITGSYVQINPLVTILSLIGGGMIWGLPGMFLVIPFLAFLKIVFENIPDLKPVAYLLGTRGTEKYSITIHSLKQKFGWVD